MLFGYHMVFLRQMEFHLDGMQNTTSVVNFYAAQVLVSCSLAPRRSDHPAMDPRNAVMVAAGARDVGG